MVSGVKPKEFGQKPDPLPFGVHESNTKSSGKKTRASSQFQEVKNKMWGISASHDMAMKTSSAKYRRSPAASIMFRKNL